MKYFWKWFRPTTKQAREPTAPDRYSARAALQRELVAGNEDQEEATFSWLGRESIHSSIYDAPSQPERPSTDNATVPEKDLQESNDDDPGYDPYNTGRFEHSKK